MNARPWCTADDEHNDNEDHPMSTHRICFSFARRFIRFATILASGAVVPGFVESCDDRLIGVTRYFDPCGTIFANCAPGSFEANAAGVGSWNVDCTCTVPGACNNDIPQDVIANICR